MSTMANLLARKRAVQERLESNPGPNEREEIERLLAQIETALSLLERGNAAAPSDEEEKCRSAPATVLLSGPIALSTCSKGFLNRGEISSLIGPPKSMKSALVTEIVIHCAGLQDWRGHLAKDLWRRDLRTGALRPVPATARTLLNSTQDTGPQAQVNRVGWASDDDFRLALLRGRFSACQNSPWAEETKGWGRPFDDPIALDDGRTFRTLRDAGEYIAALPETVHDQPEWQAALEALLLVERGGPVMFARIGVMRANNAWQAGAGD